MPGGGELLFCAHHGRTHESALRRSAVAFDDQRDDLSPTAHTASDGER
jgi:hypothetical protein